VAVGVRRGSPGRAGHPGVHPAYRRHPGGAGHPAGPGGHRAVRAGPGADRVRHPARRDVGVRPAQGRRPPLAGAVAGDLAGPVRRGGAARLHVVGASPSEDGPRRAGRSADAAEPDRAAG
jgi:hypothetical protein